MRRLALVIAACAVVSRAGAAEAPALAAHAQPFEMVRTLQALQEQIARGSIEAHAVQNGLLLKIGERFQTVDPKLWQEPRNARSAVIYLLSGGQPAVIRKLLALDPPPQIEDRIIRGALAYVEGQENQALELLRGVNARALPATLGAQIALVQSALVVRHDMKAALRLLDDARLLLPGTLVEEAALRRQIFLVGQMDDVDKFEALSIQYMRRFRHSVYAGNFRQRLAIALTRFSFAQNTAQFPRLVKMLDHLDPSSRRSLYLHVARTAVVRGKLTMARLASEQAMKLAPVGSPEYERAKLYGAMALLVTDEYPDGNRQLKEVDTARLPPRDTELLDVARTLARQVRVGPVAAPARAAEAAAPSSPSPQAPRQAARAAARIDLTSSDETIGRAQQMLSEVDELLKEDD